MRYRQLGALKTGLLAAVASGDGGGLEDHTGSPWVMCCQRPANRFRSLLGHGHAASAEPQWRRLGGLFKERDVGLVLLGEMQLEDGVEAVQQEP